MMSLSLMAGRTVQREDFDLLVSHQLNIDKINKTRMPR